MHADLDEVNRPVHNLVKPENTWTNDNLIPLNSELNQLKFKCLLLIGFSITVLVTQTLCIVFDNDP